MCAEVGTAGTPLLTGMAGTTAGPQSHRNP